MMIFQRNKLILSSDARFRKGTMLVELSKWLSANPIAFVTLNLVITTLVSIIITKGFEITDISFFPPNLKMSKKLRPIVQIGEAEFPKDDPKAKELRSELGGIRGVYTHVDFDPYFKEEPKITVSLRLIDVGEIPPYPMKINRLRVSAVHINRKGFDVLFD